MTSILPLFYIQPFEGLNQVTSKGQAGLVRANRGLTLDSSRSMLSRLLLRWMRPLMRRSDGFPWLMGRERVEEAEIAIAPAPPVAPVGSSAPEGDASPSWGVTLQHQRWSFVLESDTRKTGKQKLCWWFQEVWAHENVFFTGVTSVKLQICTSLTFAAITHARFGGNALIPQSAWCFSACGFNKLMRPHPLNTTKFKWAAFLRRAIQAFSWQALLHIWGGT